MFYEYYGERIVEFSKNCDIMTLPGNTTGIIRNSITPDNVNSST